MKRNAQRKEAERFRSGSLRELLSRGSSKRRGGGDGGAEKKAGRKASERRQRKHGITREDFQNNLPDGLSESGGLYCCLQMWSELKLPSLHRSGGGAGVKEEEEEEGLIFQHHFVC